MILSKKAKCTECLALKKIKDEQGQDIFVCVLGFSLGFNMIEGTAVSPKPLEKCFKPLTVRELIGAKKRVQQQKIKKNDKNSGGGAVEEDSSQISDW